LIGAYNSLALRQDVGALWENYLIGECIKKNLNENSGKEFYFWRTYDEQEIDLIEIAGDNIAAFEIKWGNKTSDVPQAFSTAYPQATYQVVNRNNYLEFICPNNAPIILR
jgi:predicted AAA+ superfamily ATPase